MNFFCNSLILVMCLCSSIVSANETITERVLPNGLKVVVKPDHRSPSVVFQIWYKVGSSYESMGSTGISHLLEHLMFSTNKNISLAEGFNRLNDIGSQGSAYTTRDYSFYYHVMAKEHLSLAFKVEALRMQYLAPSENEFNIEKKVIEEEMYTSIAKEPYLLAHNALYEQAFKDTSYQFPVIGRLQDIHALTLKKTMSWYKNYYTPDNAIIVVVGDISESEVFSLAQEYFLPIKKNRQLGSNTPVAKTFQKKEIRFVMPDSTKIGAVLMAFKVPSINTSKPYWEAYALEVLAGWFETGTLSRLSRALIRDKQLAHELTISYSPVYRADSLFIIEALPAQGISLARLEQAIVEEIKQIKKETISQQNLQKIKNQMIAVDIYERDSMYTQAKIIGQAESSGIHWSEDAQYISRINRITARQVKAVLHKYFVPENRTVIVQNSNTNQG